MCWSSYRQISGASVVPSTGDEADPVFGAPVGRGVVFGLAVGNPVITCSSVVVTPVVGNLVFTSSSVVASPVVDAIIPSSPDVSGPLVGSSVVPPPALTTGPLVVGLMFCGN